MGFDAGTRHGNMQLVKVLMSFSQADGVAHHQLHNPCYGSSSAYQCKVAQSHDLLKLRAATLVPNEESRIRRKCSFNCSLYLPRLRLCIIIPP